MDEMRVQDIENLPYLNLDYFVGLVNLRNFTNWNLWELENLA